MPTESAWIRPDWQVGGNNIVAGTTTRYGGYSAAQGLAENNLGLNVGDAPELVQRNRQGLVRLIEGQCHSQRLSQHPSQRPSQGDGQVPESVVVQWLDQVHGSNCLYVGATSDVTAAPQADAVWTDQPGVALAIQTADCVPVVITNTAGTRIGAAHGGWRGLVSGVLPGLVHNMSADPSELHAWVGPCIGRTHFEVGEDVWRPIGRICAEAVFPHGVDNRKRLVDLPLLTQYQLYACGVGSVSQSGLCTYAGEAFYSHRQATHARGQGAQTGRMATFIFRMA